MIITSRENGEFKFSSEKKELCCWYTKILCAMIAFFKQVRTFSGSGINIYDHFFYFWYSVPLKMVIGNTDNSKPALSL